MKYLWLLLGIFFGIGTISTGIEYITKGQQEFGVVVVFVLLTGGCIYLYKRAKKNTIVHSLVHPVLKKSLGLEEFFEKPIEDTIQKLDTEFDGSLCEEEKQQNIANIIGYLIELAYKDGIITEEEEEKITHILSHYSLQKSNLPSIAYEMLAKGLIIRDLLQGKCHDRVVVQNNVFNLMKNEKVIYAFTNIPMFEIATVKEYQSGSNGVSFRIMKGVYYHTGGSKGRHIEKQVVKSLGSSSVIVTNKYVYCQTSNSAIRIRHDKIVSIIPDDESVIVFRDGARQNPICFETNDAWFLANILRNAHNVE